MLWVGLTGGIGCGKSTVADILRKYGYAVIDADAIVHQEYSSNKDLQKKLADTFGKNILTVNGVDREKLAGIVFRDASKRELLEKMVHPLVQKRVQEQKENLLKQKKQLAFYDVPLLFEVAMEDRFDLTIAVVCDFERAWTRVQNRNTWSKTEFEKRWKAQLPVEEKAQRATFAIWNDGSLEELKRRIQDLIEKILKTKKS